MKKKILLLVITLAMLLTSFTSCQYTRWQKVIYNYQKDLISALNNEDYDALAKLFAPSVASAPEFEAKAATLFSMLQPQVVNLADGPYGGANGYNTHSSFSVKSNDKVYEIAILICFKAQYSTDEIGLLSLYVTDNYDKITYYHRTDTLGCDIHWDEWIRGIVFE